MGLKGRFLYAGFILVLLMQFFVPVTSVFAKEDATVSTIGGIEITVNKQSAIQAVLAQAIAEWKSRPIVVTGQSGRLTIPTEYIRFDVQGTTETYLAASKSPWYMPWKKQKIVHLPLQVEVTEEINNMLKENPFFHLEEMTNSLLEHASFLKTHEVTAIEIEMTKDFMDRTAFEIQPIPKSRTSLSALVAMLDGVVLAENETFSFLKRTEEIASSTDIEAKRFFASMLYSVALQAETTILERHSQHKIPGYLQRGIEVDVSNRLQKDFVFKNNSHSPMLFHAAIENNHLLIELYTLKDVKEITYSVVETKVEPKTIYRLSAELTDNQRRVVQVGEDGYRVTVYRSSQEEMFAEEEEISRDFYAPVHKIIEVSSQSERVNDSSHEEKSSGNDTKDDEKEQSNYQKNKNNLQDPDDDPEKEVIYDKGGNVIEDPNA